MIKILIIAAIVLEKIFAGTDTCRNIDVLLLPSHYASDKNVELPNLQIQLSKVINDQQNEGLESKHVGDEISSERSKNEKNTRVLAQHQADEKKVQIFIFIH